MNLNSLPWKVALTVADFIEDMETVQEKYNKAFNAIQFQYGKLAEKHEDEKNTVDESKAKNDDIEELLEMDTELELRIPKIQERVFKRIYEEQDENNDNKKKSAEDNIKLLPVDLKAFRKLGIMITEEDK
jgi:hypothetical protein